MNSREIDNKINSVFDKYQLFKIRLNHLELLNNKLDDEKINEMRNYINYIDDIVNFISKKDKIISKIYIENKTFYDLPVSRSGFYSKRRKYNDVLYKYLFEEF